MGNGIPTVPSDGGRKVVEVAYMPDSSRLKSALQTFCWSNPGKSFRTIASSSLSVSINRLIAQRSSFNLQEI